MDPWNCPPNPKSKEALTRVSHVTRAGVLHTTSLSQAPVLGAASGSRKGGWEAWGGWHLTGQLAVLSFWWLSPTIYESVSVSLFLHSPCFFRFHIEVKSINCALPYVDSPAKFWASLYFAVSSCYQRVITSLGWPPGLVAVCSPTCPGLCLHLCITRPWLRP